MGRNLSQIEFNATEWMALRKEQLVSSGYEMWNYRIECS